MHAAGVNPVDTYIRSGTYNRRPMLPYIPGLDSAGTIERLGPDVNKFKVITIVRRDGRFRTQQSDGGPHGLANIGAL